MDDAANSGLNIHSFLIDYLGSMASLPTHRIISMVPYIAILLDVKITAQQRWADTAI